MSGMEAAVRSTRPAAFVRLAVPMRQGGASRVLQGLHTEQLMTKLVLSARSV